MKLRKFFLKGYDNMNFAEKVKLLRKRNELTQEELAKQVGTSQRTIFTYE
ncbi:helix-turn-helix domain-containing protein, partial [Ruminococcus sp.]|nr:helix-turn-helix domain-containing protein [Ruminococcus sp.]